MSPLKLVRLSAGMTLRELGALLGLNPATVHKYETGKITIHELTRKRIRRICRGRSLFEVVPKRL